MSRNKVINFPTPEPKPINYKICIKYTDGWGNVAESLAPQLAEEGVNILEKKYPHFIFKKFVETYEPNLF